MPVITLYAAGFLCYPAAVFLSYFRPSYFFSVFHRNSTNIGHKDEQV
jgi:hypothetical protein